MCFCFVVSFATIQKYTYLPQSADMDENLTNSKPSASLQWVIKERFEGLGVDENGKLNLACLS